MRIIGSIVRPQRIVRRLPKKVLKDAIKLSRVGPKNLKKNFVNDYNH